MGDLISSASIRAILNRHMKLGQWYHLNDIYRLVSDNYDFSTEDLKPYRDSLDHKHWQHQVGNVLSKAKNKGHACHEYSRRILRSYARLRWLD